MTHKTNGIAQPHQNSKDNQKLVNNWIKYKLNRSLKITCDKFMLKFQIWFVTSLPPPIQPVLDDLQK